MQITLYQRTYPVKDSPISSSLVPLSLDQKHTYTVGGKVYDAVRREIQIIVPDDAKIDKDKNLLSWTGEKGIVKSNANEVYGFAEAGVSGFKTIPASKS
jgi:hypothetical protein